MDGDISFWASLREIRATVGGHLRFELPHWLYWGGLLSFPLFYMVALRLAGRKRKTAEAVVVELADEIEGDVNPTGHIDRYAPGNWLTRQIDALSVFTGAFVAYWTVIAVVVYFYEVVARRALLAPTNWAHESMFLMFGMQYVIAGAYAYRFDAHVRVDLFYANASIRNRAALDIITSIFFFIFALGFTATSWTFFSQSMSQTGEVFGIPYFWAQGYSNELSFTEWAVAYYPVKFAMVIGGVLLLLQGLSRLIKDIEIFVFAANGRDPK